MKTKAEIQEYRSQWKLDNRDRVSKHNQRHYIKNVREGRVKSPELRKKYGYGPLF